MLTGFEAKGQNFRQCPGFIAIGVDHINDKIILAEFPHDLPAHTAGRKSAGDDAIFAAAYGDGDKIPVTVIYCFEKGEKRTP